MEFVEFPKMARLSREVIVTEKIDGTNAAVVVADGAVYAQSRSRIITPADDNFGFAAWVAEHADELAAGLGPGRHFGEWWGAGIQRRYGLSEKRFSLFNATRWADGEPQPIPSLDPRAEPKMQQKPPACCHVVPVLWRGNYDALDVQHLLRMLAETGSSAAPGFMKPEGLVVFHTAGNVGFKKTLEKDDQPKGRPLGTGEQQA